MLCKNSLLDDKYTTYVLHVAARAVQSVTKRIEKRGGVILCVREHVYGRKVIVEYCVTK